MTRPPYTADSVTIPPLYREALLDLLYQLADDDLVLGHRASEWLGVAPDIEEDVAFSSISQDEVGHAVFYYTLLESLGQGTADELAFERPVHLRRNAVLTERPIGDWAYTIARHYFYDVFEDVRLQALENSSYEPLRKGAWKIRREEYYHLLHHELWFQRLAQAGGEARQRLVTAMAQLAEDVGSLFDVGPHSGVLFDQGILPVRPKALQDQWRLRVLEVCNRSGLEWPANLPVTQSRSEHTPDLIELVQTLNEVHDWDRQAVW